VAANGLTLMMQVQGVKRLASNKALMYSLINRMKVRATNRVIDVLSRCSNSSSGLAVGCQQQGAHVQPDKQDQGKNS
jgi:hypothetical protein